ncbi:cAMP-binding domain of CRP or a regulatory subunit of cAMP-dependent protein kinases [Aneurinibacillus thermoaerophilus]|uniref:cAMP-binding domain of CRP or a regulatory subunit of cAMP-dependent protein kinases n=4 Tax=Aneurinibacillus group TaxID=85151 RepID=A0A1G8DVP2_ANETH|nr:cAMP-binding domain of CRP or a regulatory subunit of cAMP-dependent protein kinases [Aneurinibacillus thermoaerophilus]
MMATIFETEYNWEPYLKYGTRQFVKRKTVIYNQGSIGDGFYYLHKGLVRIVTSTVKGRKRILNIVVPGQILGIQSLDQYAHFTTAVTVKDCVLYYFPRDQFKDLIMIYPDLRNLFAQTIIHKMRILLEGIKLNTLSSEQQIAILLLNIYDDFKNYKVPLSQQDLANCTGLTRITVYKILKQWREDKIIQIQNRRFIIKRPELLKRLVKEPSHSLSKNV